MNAIMHNYLMLRIQAVLQQLRRCMSQSEISRRTSIAQSKLSRWEAGRVAAGAEDALVLASLARQVCGNPLPATQESTHA